MLARAFEAVGSLARCDTSMLHIPGSCPCSASMRTCGIRIVVDSIACEVLQTSTESHAVGLQVSRCQVREMRALLLEARRLSSLQRPDLAAEADWLHAASAFFGSMLKVRGRLGRNPQRTTSSEELIRPATFERLDC